MISQTSVPRFDMNQADVTPLISALLSLAVPKNNCGILPRQYLNASMVLLFMLRLHVFYYSSTFFIHLRTTLQDKPGKMPSSCISSIIFGNKNSAKNSSSGRLQIQKKNLNQSLKISGKRL